MADLTDEELYITERWSMSAPNRPVQRLIAELRRRRAADLDHCRRCDFAAYPPGHDAPYRKLTESEIEKLQRLCDDRSYLYWWDMGSALLTLKGAREDRLAADLSTEEVAELRSLRHYYTLTRKSAVVLDKLIAAHGKERNDG